jgi:hypothetical protein
VAAEYNAHRPTYPYELVDRACIDLASEGPVLEVGCGTGQLTRTLVLLEVFRSTGALG